VARFRVAVCAAAIGALNSKPIPGDDASRNAVVTRDELLKRISINPNVCFGKPCIRGHRIWVSLILDLLASGSSIEDVVADYPGIEEADVRACIAYGAEMSRERFVDIPIEPNPCSDDPR
jgi:uncharacterized protein (DUF433 family)